MVRDSVIKKWVENVEDFIIWGLPDDFHEDPDKLNDNLGDAIEQFCRANRYSEKTSNELLNIIEVRDEFYKALSRNGYTLPCDSEGAED